MTDIDTIRRYIEQTGAKYINVRFEGDESIVSVILPGTPPEGEDPVFKVDVSVDIGETE